MDYTVYTIFDSQSEQKERYQVNIADKYTLIVDSSGWFYFDSHLFFPVTSDWYGYGENDLFVYRKSINNSMLFGVKVS